MLPTKHEDTVLELKLDNWVIARLSEPFPVDEVKFRTGSAGTVLAYIDARQVISRLDSVVGSANWSDTYYTSTFTVTEVRDVTNPFSVRKELEDLGTDTSVIDSIIVKDRFGKPVIKNKAFARYEYNDITYSGIECDLRVLGVTKEDVGTPSMAEQIKGSTSDALKRAAVKFGIGAYLYDLKGLRGDVAAEHSGLPAWAHPTERANPDNIIKELIVTARKKVTDNNDRELLERAISEVEVMGVYFSGTPLIVKRALYEYITKLLRND